MSSVQHCQASAVLAGRDTFAWFNIATRWVQRVRAHWRARRERRELLDFLAVDYRAAADIGITHCEAQALSQRPFWRA